MYVMLLLCCVVLCRVASFRVVSCPPVLCCVVLVLCCVVLCCVVLCCVVLCCVVLCCVVLCCVVLCCVVLCCVVLCCVVLCCVDACARRNTHTHTHVQEYLSGGGHQLATYVLKGLVPGGPPRINFRPPAATTPLTRLPLCPQKPTVLHSTSTHDFFLCIKGRPQGQLYLPSACRLCPSDRRGFQAQSVAL